jgi:hypothetical protein
MNRKRRNESPLCTSVVTHHSAQLDCQLLLLRVFPLPTLAQFELESMIEANETKDNEVKYYVERNLILLFKNLIKELQQLKTKKMKTLRNLLKWLKSSRKG